MKKLSFLALAAVGLLLGACTSDKDDVTQEQTNQYDLIEGESAWIRVGISMPGDVITRSNEDLNDGIEAEWTVKSGTLYLFKGENEDDATLFGSYDITGKAFHNETGDQVPEGNTEGAEADGYGEISQTSATFVQEITSPNLGANDKLYAYVILNDKSNATGLVSTGKTGKQFKEQVLKAIGIADETKGFGAIGNYGLVMTNVPISNVAGGPDDPSSATITTFTEILPTAVYDTKAKAEATGAQVACIYVERAAVKVEVILGNDAANIIVPGQASISVTDFKWALGNVNNNGTNSGYYNTRQFDNDWLPYYNEQLGSEYSYLKYRMVGRTNFFASGHTTAYRTYFGRDVNYTGNTGLIGGLLQDDPNDNTKQDYKFESNAVTYTYENTFDENSQVYRNTTYVGVKVTTNAGDFYTIEGQPNTVLVDADAIGAVLSTRMKDEINTHITPIQTAINADLATSGTGRKLPTTITKVTFNLGVEVTIGDRKNDGTVTYTAKVALKDVKDQDGNTLSSDDVAKVKELAGDELATLSSTAKVYKYLGGVMYYAARISHFGDIETPWDAVSEAYNIYPKIYPLNGKKWQTTDTNPDASTGITYGASRAAAWLGRWGIVRNNWYRVTISSITGLGAPVPEDFSGSAEGSPGNTPDDNPEPKYYIAAHVHILPWAVRKQSVNF